MEVACEIKLLFEFQFESELAFISEIRSEFLEFVLQLTFACALEVGQFLSVSARITLGAMAARTLFQSPRIVSNHCLVSENTIFGVREEHC